MKLNKIILLLLTVNICFGQFKTIGKLKKVSQNGFHEILLSPEIRSYSNQDLSDIRIIDSKDKEVPYFIQNSTNSSSSNFEEYNIVSKKTEPKKSTSIIITVPAGKNSKGLSLFIANSDVTKTYSVSGSNDQQEWFGISDAQSLYDLNSTTESSVIKTISYPLSTYKYLKIVFDDKKTLPINILKVGNFNTNITTHSFQEITPIKILTTEIPAEKETEVHLLFNAPQIINQVVFEISKPTYYNRKAILYKKTTQQIKRKSIIVEEELASFELNSNVKNSFTIPEIFEKELFIKIENQDNLPLQISSVKFNQNPISLIADLTANENYIIKTGNKNLTQPEYDLSNFKNNISGILPQTSIYDVHQTAQAKIEAQKRAFWEEPWFMWICIAAGGITILLFTASLIKDLKKQN
jgi:hypothetical protein